MPLKIYFCHIAKRLHNNSAYRKENRTRHQIQHFKKQIHWIKTLDFRPPMQCLIFFLKRLRGPCWFMAVLNAPKNLISQDIENYEQINGYYLTYKICSMVDLESWGAGFENLTKLFFRRGSIITPFSETVHKNFSRVSHIFLPLFKRQSPFARCQ